MDIIILVNIKIKYYILLNKSIDIKEFFLEKLEKILHIEKYGIIDNIQNL